MVIIDMIVKLKWKNAFTKYINKEASRLVWLPTAAAMIQTHVIENTFTSDSQYDLSLEVTVAFLMQVKRSIKESAHLAVVRFLRFYECKKI